MNIAIIQARMDSHRLPGKVLMPIAGRPMLWHVFEAVRQCRSVDRVVVACPYGGENGAIAAACAEWEVACHWEYDGPTNNVLGRFVSALARHPSAARVLRVCGDSPLFDAQAADELFAASVESGADYTGYAIDGSPAVLHPTGYFGEVVTRAALELADLVLGLHDPRREHVTQCMYDGNEPRFRCRWVDVPTWYASEPMKSAAVDTLEDYERVKRAIE